MESVAAVDASQPTKPWAFLTMDLLLDVSGRLHDARDFVRFHAVCRPWRNAAPEEPDSRQFLPWMLSQNPGRGSMLMHTPVVYSGTISPEATLSNHPCYDGNLLPSSDDMALVAGTDGEAVWRLAQHPNKPALRDVVTGAVYPLPNNYGFEVRMMKVKPHGLMYADGTVFLYSFVRLNFSIVIFTAAILRPGDTAWITMEHLLRRSPDQSETSINFAAYHHGKVFVWVGKYFYCFVPQDLLANNAGHIDITGLEIMDDRPEHKRYMRYYNYVFESRGELLWASVLLDKEWFEKHVDTLSTNDPVVPALAVMVHSAEEEEADSGNGKMKWVEKDGRSLGDRVLFLGYPASFAVDATQLSMDGGCAYFVFLHRLFRHNLITGETKHVESPRTGWISPDAHMWLRPRPVIVPINEIGESLRIRLDKNEDQKWITNAIDSMYKWFLGFCLVAFVLGFGPILS